MGFDWHFILEHSAEFGGALWVTLKVGVISILCSALFGLGNATAIYLRLPYFETVIKAYVEIARNTPLLIQLFVIYFGFPQLGWSPDGETSAYMAMIFLGTAYMTKLFRGGYMALSNQQQESALALGLSRWQTLWWVLWPQLGRMTFPTWAASAIFLLKETTVVSAVAVPEILYTTTNYIALYYKTYEMLAVMTGLYVLLFVPLSLTLRQLEGRLLHGWN